MLGITIHWIDREPERIIFDRPMQATIGRGAACTVCIDTDPMVSRMHAVLVFEPPSLTIKDLGSTNGIMINGVPLGGMSGMPMEEPRQLKEGDEVIVGSTVIAVGEEAGSASGTRPTRAINFNRDKKNLSETMAGSAADAGKGMEQTVGGLDALLPEIPGYRIQRTLGQGKMGEVYLARANDSGENAAVKIINMEAPFTKKMIDDLKHELEGARMLRHSGFVRLLGTRSLGPKCICLLLEYINGENLSSYLSRCPGGRLPVKPAHELMLQLCSTMCYAHSQGFVHRDLKPQSILLYSDGGRVLAKITDIGLAKCLEDSGIGTAESGPNAGNTDFTPPELMADLRETKATADVFSLSAMYYWMLTGQTPYTSGSVSPGMAAACEIIPIEERMPELPEPLVVIIERGLSREPEERYQNCCDMLEALENVRV